MKQRLAKISLLMLSFATLTFANDADIANMGKIYTKDDTVISGGACSFKCRDVVGEYKAQIIGYDFVNGTTYCSVKETQNFLDTKYNANQQNLACIEEYTKQKLPELKTEKKDFNIKSTITQTPSDTDITFSRFIAGLVTLDPNIINRDATNETGQLVLKDGVTQRAQVTDIYKWGLKQSMEYLGKMSIGKLFVDPSVQKSYSIDEGKNLSLSDGFNKANMSYFSNLFKNISEVYNYLQNVLFTLIGGFYLATLGGKKLFTYLENREEQQSSQAYLHKFFTPLIAFAFFFMPIPEGQNSKDQATIVQNIIRFAAAKSTDIADIASAKGAETYINKIIASVGGSDNRAEIYHQQNIIRNTFIKQKAKSEYKKCEERYAGVISKLHKPFAQMTEQEIEELTGIDIKQVSQKADITLSACASLQQQLFEANKKINESQHLLKAQKAFNSNAELQKNIKDIDAFIANREKQLGWFNSIITASSAKMIEIQDEIQDALVQPKESIDEISEKSKTATEDEISQGVVTNASKQYSDKAIQLGVNYIFQKLAWYILPGAMSIHDTISDYIGKITAAAGAMIGSVIPGLGTAIGGLVGAALGWFFSNIAALIMTQIIMERFLELLPTLTVCISALIISVGYIVTLCKYFYISPFVVAFALSTKQLDKITQFLISGITIILQPVLIILFIYLALFLTVLINEFFILMAAEQFNGIPLAFSDINAIIKIGIIKELIKIFGGLAACYIIWKLIISGPKWIMDMLGINANAGGNIMDTMAQNLEKRSFV